MRKPITGFFSSICTFFLLVSTPIVNAAADDHSNDVKVHLDVPVLKYLIIGKSRVREGGGDEQFSNARDISIDSTTGGTPEVGIEYDRWLLDVGTAAVEVGQMQTSTFGVGLFLHVENKQTITENIWNPSRTAADSHLTSFGPSARYQWTLSPALQLLLHGYILKIWENHRDENIDSSARLTKDDTTSYSGFWRIAANLGLQFQLADRLALLSELSYFLGHYKSESINLSEGTNSQITQVRYGRTGKITHFGWQVIGVRIFF